MGRSGKTPVDIAVTTLLTIRSRLVKNRRELILLRFEQGAALKGIVNNVAYGQGAVSVIAEEIDEWPSVLYRAYHLAAAFEFSESAIKAALNQLEEENRKISYSSFERKFVNLSNPDTFGGPEAAKEYHLNQAEHAAHSLEEAGRIVGNTPEVQGTALMVVNAIDSYEQKQIPMLPFRAGSILPDSDSGFVVCHVIVSAAKEVRVGIFEEGNGKKKASLHTGDEIIPWSCVLTWIYESDYLASSAQFLEAL